jgi:hypothetical protein
MGINHQNQRNLKKLSESSRVEPETKIALSCWASRPLPSLANEAGTSNDTHPHGQFFLLKGTLVHHIVVHRDYSVGIEKVILSKLKQRH